MIQQNTLFLKKALKIKIFSNNNNNKCNTSNLMIRKMNKINIKKKY